MKHIPLILLIMFLAALAALCFAIEIDFRNRPCKVCGMTETELAYLKGVTSIIHPQETEIIKNGKVYEIIAKY